MERFELARARDFKSTIIKYLEDQMAHQQQVKRLLTEIYDRFMDVGVDRT